MEYSFGIPSAVSIVESRAKQGLVIYPNPASDFLNIDCRTEIRKVSIADFNGREILSQDQTVIDVTGIENGVYFLKIETQDGILTRGIVIQN